MKPKSSVDRHENISRVRSQIAPQPRPVCWSLLFAGRPTPNLFGIAFLFCNASLPGGAMLRLEHLAFPFVLASQSQLRGLSTRGVTDSLLQNSPSFHRANIFIL